MMFGLYILYFVVPSSEREYSVIDLEKYVEVFSELDEDVKTKLRMYNNTFRQFQPNLLAASLNDLRKKFRPFTVVSSENAGLISDFDAEEHFLRNNSENPFADEQIRFDDTAKFLQFLHRNALQMGSAASGKTRKCRIDGTFTRRILPTINEARDSNELDEVTLSSEQPTEASNALTFNIGHSSAEQAIQPTEEAENDVHKFIFKFKN